MNAGQIVRRRPSPRPRYAIFAIITDDRGRVLVFQDTNPSSTTTHRRFKFPGGGFEKKDATLAHTVKREVQEETGLTVDLQPPFLWMAEQHIPALLPGYPESSEYKVFVHARVTGGILAPRAGKNYARLGFENPLDILSGKRALKSWHAGALRAFQAHLKTPHPMAPVLPIFESHISLPVLQDYAPKPKVYRVKPQATKRKRATVKGA